MSGLDRCKPIWFAAAFGKNQDQKGKTAIHYGVERAFDPDLLRWLVKHGASPDIEDRAGVSPREKATRKRDKRFLAALS